MQLIINLFVILVSLLPLSLSCKSNQRKELENYLQEKRSKAMTHGVHDIAFNEAMKYALKVSEGHEALLLARLKAWEKEWKLCPVFLEGQAEVVYKAAASRSGLVYLQLELEVGRRPILHGDITLFDLCKEVEDRGLKEELRTALEEAGRYATVGQILEALLPSGRHILAASEKRPNLALWRQLMSWPEDRLSVADSLIRDGLWSPKDRLTSPVERDESAFYHAVAIAPPERQSVVGALLDAPAEFYTSLREVPGEWRTRYAAAYLVLGSKPKDMKEVEVIARHALNERLPALLKAGVEVSRLQERPWALQLEALNKALFVEDNELPRWVGEFVNGYAGTDFAVEKLGALSLKRVELGIDTTPRTTGLWMAAFAPQSELSWTRLEEKFVLHQLEGVDPKSLPGFSKGRKVRVNDAITSPTVSVIDATGEMLDPMPLTEALEMARSSDMDLVEVGPAKCRIMRHKEPKNRKLETALAMFSFEGNRKAYKSLLQQDGSAPLSASAKSKLEELRALSVKRKQYADEAWRFISRHATNRGPDIASAWKERPRALEAGVKDSVSAILEWVALNGFKQWCLQEEEEHLLEHPWVPHLLKRYRNDPSEVGEFLAMVKVSEEAALPAWRVGVGEFQFEVLPKNDARGATLGFDTGCCMTLGGASETCIYDGYARRNAGFIALYKGENVSAQSFFFIEGDTLVLDNIEAGEGRSFSGIVDAYQKALEQYLGEHPEVGIKKVHLGTGYMEVPVEDLPRTKVVMPSAWELEYSDADEEQRLLLER